MKLILLRCPNCRQPLSPENDDVVVACANCHRPVMIGENGPSLTDVYFTLPLEAKKPREAELWHPFWVFEGRVHITARETQGWGSSGEESEAFWQEPRRFYVPAWDLSMRHAQEVGSRLTQGQPNSKFIGRPDEAQLVPATVGQGDALKLIEFIVLAIEARRKDWLKDLVFKLEMEEPALWALQKSSWGIRD